jgi:hypothetical protein
MRVQPDSGGVQAISTRFLRRVTLALAAAALVSTAAQAGTPYVVGHVFAGVGNSQVKEFTPTGTLVQTLNDTTGTTYTTGMCFDAAGNLYVTNYSGSTVSKFDNSGNLVNASFLTGLGSPESCVLDSAGNFYVGGPGQPIMKFGPSGGAPIQTFAVTAGSDWIDLAADQCTMFYDNEGANISRFNVCTNTQLANFNAAPLPGRHYALRILPGGGVIVAAGTQVQMLNSSGVITSTYTGDSFFFALNRDPDGVTFWSGGLNSGNILRFNFSPVGPPITTFPSAPFTSLAGLAVFGELVVSQPTPTPTGTALATATPTPTPPATATPTSPPPQAVVPTLSFPMLGLLALALAAAALLLMRR